MVKYVAYPGVIDALKELREISYVDMTKQAGISKDTIDRMRRGTPVSKESFYLVAKCLDVPAECLGRPATLSREASYWYTFLGLYADPGEEKPDDVAFQDFQLHEGRLNNPISNLWSSAEGSEISARALSEDRDRLLRISFHNEGMYPCNVGIHPTCLTARKKHDSQVYLTFLARVPDHEDLQLTDADPGSGKKTTISVRIGDGQLEQWEYKDKVSYLLPSVDGPDWSVFVVDLDFNAAHPHWEKFGTAVAFPGEEPDFSVITNVVIEVGRGNPGHRPGPGDGIVDIKRIHLTANRDFLKDAV